MVRGVVRGLVGADLLGLAEWPLLHQENPDDEDGDKEKRQLWPQDAAQKQDGHEDSAHCDSAMSCLRISGGAVFMNR